MGSFLTRATGTGNSFAASGADIKGQDWGGVGGYQQLLNNNFGSQNQLAGQYQQIANGQGPNPAHLMMQSGTDRATKQNAGMLASQKGISPGMANRLAAQNQAQMGQAAAGQGAQMQANQQLAAMGQMGNAYGQIGNQGNSALSTMQNAMSAYNNAQAGMQSNMNNVNAGVAGQNAATAGGLMGGFMNSIGGAMSGGGMLGGAEGGEVPNDLTKLNPQQNKNNGPAEEMPGAFIPVSGIMQPVQKMADGGPVIQNWGFGGPNIDNNTVQSYAGKWLNSGADALEKGTSKMLNPVAKDKSKQQFDMAGTTGGEGGSGAGGGWEMGGGMAGGPMDAMGGAGGGGGLMDAVGGGEGMGSLALLAASRGLEVPGSAKVKGDSFKNDKVHALLSPKEIVLPRSVTLAPDAPERAKAFVAAVQARHGHHPMKTVKGKKAS